MKTRDPLLVLQDALKDMEKTAIWLRQSWDRCRIIPVAGPHLKRGRVRALAVTSKQRVAALPELPTVHESGVPGYEYIGWYGLLAPAATPAAIIARLNTEANKFIKTREFSERIAADGAEPTGGTPEAFAALIRTEIAKWAAVVKHAGLAGQ